jgi:hypothetical protein
VSEFPDVEGAVRTYLRAHTDVTALCGTRVFFAVPRQATYPLVVVTRVGGFDDTSDAPLDQALIQVDCWGDLHTDTIASPDKAQAAAVLRAVRQAFYDLTHQPAVVSVAGDDPHDVRLAGAQVQSDPYVPDPDNRRPRYAVTAQVTAARLVAA